LLLQLLLLLLYCCGCCCYYTTCTYFIKEETLLANLSFTTVQVCTCRAYLQIRLAVFLSFKRNVTLTQ
jgi:hypothetical protein